VFFDKIKDLHYKKLFIYGGYITILALSLLGAMLDTFVENYVDVWIDLLFGFLTFVALWYSFGKKDIELSALLLFWIAISIEFVFLYIHDVDFDLIFAIFIPILAFISLPKWKIIFHLMLFYLLLFSFLLYYYYAYPEHAFLHNSKYMVAYFIAHLFMVFYGIFYYMAIDESVQRLEISNQEKALLLREVHHRVKNNLNLIASILGLQGQSTYSIETKEVVEGNRKRIESMALLHEILYKNENLNGVDLKAYIHTLVDHIIECEALGDRVTIVSDIAPVKLTVDDMIQLGIMLNEMVTNSIKYASDERDRVKIKITFGRDEGGYRLVYCDNASQIDRSKLNRGFGYNLIMLTVSQLKGSPTVFTEQGLCYTISFDSLEEVEF
jgi:two-component sensor histidine kinase